jgi:hypothetical protein
MRNVWLLTVELLQISPNQNNVMVGHACLTVCMCEVILEPGYTQQNQRTLENMFHECQFPFHKSHMDWLGNYALFLRCVYLRSYLWFIWQCFQQLRLYCHQMVAWLVNNDYDRTWKWTYFSGGARNNLEKPKAIQSVSHTKPNVKFVFRWHSCIYAFCLLVILLL